MIINLLNNLIKDIEVFTNFTTLFYKVLLPLMIVFLISGFIGLERQNIGKSAGISAHILVALSSTAISILQRLIFDWQITHALAGMDVRPEGQRIIAQVVTGVGFIGAGVILKDNRNTVRGLTTAATIWTVAIVGIILGSGYIYTGTIFGLFVSVFILFRDLNRGINPFVTIEKQDLEHKD